MDDELEAFCEMQYRQLVGLLVMTTGDRMIAEELAQDTLERVCQHWPKVRGLDRPDAWARRVAINLANSWFRRRGAERRANARHGADREQFESDPALDLTLNRAVERLPRRQRTAVVLRFVVGLSVAEVAVELGCAEGTVKSLTHRALSRLRQDLDSSKEVS